jgi:multiple sugar transport system permease protein
MRNKLKSSVPAYLFIAPQLAGFMIFVLGPTIAVIFFSMHSRNLLTGTNLFTGLENYREMFTGDPLFGKTLCNSLIFTLGLVPVNMVTALALALLLTRQIRGAGFFRTVFFAPVVTSAVAWAIVWRFLLQGDAGLVNQCLGLIGIQGPNWLQSPSWAMVSVIFTRVFKNLGMNLVLYLAAITNLPEEYMEAARIDGASVLQILARIKIPLLWPTTLMISVLTVIGSLKVFDHIMLLTAGGPGNSTMVLVYYIYYQGFQFFETGYASALAVVLFGIVLALTLTQWRMRTSLSHYET